MLCHHCFREQTKSPSRRFHASTLHACSLLLVERFGKPVLTTSGHQEMIPPKQLQTPPHSGGRGENRLQSKDVAGGWGVPDEPKGEATHSQERENVHLPKQQNNTNGYSERRESRKEHRDEVDKYTAPNLFFPIKSHFHTALKQKHSDAGKSTWRGFFNNTSPCPWCQLLLLSRRLSLWAEERCMFLPSRYHLNIWAFKK